MMRDFFERRLQTRFFNPVERHDSAGVFCTSQTSAAEQFKWTSEAMRRDLRSFILDIGFLESVSPNAIADQWQGEYLIGIHVALFVAINEFAMFCFAQRDFFPELGNPAKESSPKPWNEQLPGIWLIDNTLKGGGVYTEHSETLIPTDPDRYVYSQLLALLMARFVWLHELAHCFNGHVDLVQRRDIALRLHELPEGLDLAGKSKSEGQELSDDEKLTLRCLELDADESAFFANCAVQMRNMENIEGIRGLENDVALKMAIFASYAMVWLFDAFQDYAKSSLGDTHPPPSLRLQNLLQTAQQRLFVEQENFEQLHGRAMKEFDPIKEVIPSMFGFGTLRDMAHSDALAAELEQLEQKRADVASMLRPYEFSLKKG